MRLGAIQVAVAMAGFLVLLTRQRDDVKPPSHQLVAVAASLACCGCAINGIRRYAAAIGD